MSGSNVGVKFVRYGGELIPVQEGATIEEVKDGMIALYPELEDAILHIDENSVGIFFIEAGDKGNN